MLFKDARCFYYGILPFMLLILACAAYAYYVNAQRANDDPQKRDFHLVAILLAPVTWPFFILASILIFLLRTLLFGAALILFMLALIGIRETTILKRLRRKVLSFGNKLLEANTALIKLWTPRAMRSRSQKSPHELDYLTRRFV
jgi:hypothetical protein